VLAGCHEFPCEEPVELDPEPMPIAGEVRFTYFTTRGVQTTRDPSEISARSRAAVLIQHPDDDLPVGIVRAADLSEGVPEDSILTTHGIAARRAYTGLVGGWVADRVWGLSQHVAEDIEKAVASDSGEEAAEARRPFGDIDLDALDRKRRTRWMTVLKPRLIDVGLHKKPRELWVFDREGCYAEDVPEDARRFDVESLEDARKMLQILTRAEDGQASVPALWRPRFDRD